jgi:tol-pal system protein YbgF
MRLVLIGLLALLPLSAMAAPVSLIPSEQAISPELEVRLAAYEEEVRRLTGDIEQAQFKNKQLETRLTVLEKAQAAAKAATPAVVNPPKPAATEKPAAEKPAGTLTDSDETKEYNDAFGLLKSGDYAGAEKGFSKFLKDFPKSPLADNARYWAGETYYVRKDYVRAAEEFLKVYQNFPKSGKAPGSLLKLGLSLASLNNTAGACRTYDRLLKEYPTSAAPIQARATAERKRLGCK